MLVLSWNLFHGRSVPDAPRSLLDDFAEQLAAWEWDVALLQEVPPWWPPALGRACGASARTALTSRNWLHPASRWAAERRPDVIKSWGGGANAILVRGESALDHRVRTLRSWPERRVVHGVRLERGWWVCNVHAQAHSEARAQADVARAAATAIAWSAGAPGVLGGDLNTRVPVAPGFEPVAGHSVDHVLARLLRAGEPGRTLRHGQLSDHAPVLAHVA
ncbi:MAG: endonuclease/exonuclease/phosphatase family protein [Solirubrobacteraceae bacterium]